MPLDDASASPPSFSSDGHPSSDTDPFSSTEPAISSPYTLDAARLTRPISIVGALTATPARGVDLMVARILNTANRRMHEHTGRMMTPEEWQAVAENISKAVTCDTYGRAAGIALAARSCYRGWSTFRLPMWQPNLEKFNPNELGIFRGRAARVFLHSIRITSYYGLGFFCGMFVGLNVGYALAFRGISQDPRLQDLMATLRLGMSRGRGQSGMPQTGAQNALHSSQDSDDLGPNKTASGSSTSSGTSGRYADDDMSPTGGAFYESYVGGSDIAPGVIRDESAAGRGRTLSSASKTPPKDASQSHVQARRTSSDDGGSWSRGQAPSSPWSSSGNTVESPDASESSWDRIRREAASESNRKP